MSSAMEDEWMDTQGLAAQFAALRESGSDEEVGEDARCPLVHAH